MGIIILGSFINNSGSLPSYYIAVDLAPATLHLDFFDDYALHLLMQERRRALVNESTAVRFHMIYSHFNTKRATGRLPRTWLSAQDMAVRLGLRYYIAVGVGRLFWPTH